MNKQHKHCKNSFCPSIRCERVPLFSYTVGGRSLNSQNLPWSAYIHSSAPLFMPEESYFVENIFRLPSWLHRSKFRSEISAIYSTNRSQTSPQVSVHLCQAPVPSLTQLVRMPIDSNSVFWWTTPPARSVQSKMVPRYHGIDSVI